ncbi:hypothetical protein MCT03_17945 [Vibrio aestuarianus]|nr:hypothetical protein [Vibrio aestuarianus]
MNKDDFYNELDKFTVLPGHIDSLSKSSFEAVQLSDVAKKHSNIVYVWRTEEYFPRFKGQSNILYIGQTKQSFAARYRNYAKWITTKANALKYSHAIEKYGPITISVCDFSKFGSTLEQAEGQLLWWYFQNHCEYPPINYTKTKVRTDECT